MTNPDLAAIIASLPPLTFAPASEAPVSLQWCLVAPGVDDDWTIARKTAEGWVNDDEAFIAEPLLYAALPAAPFKSQYLLEFMAQNIAEHLANNRFDEAARLIDELAGEVARVRDSPLARVAAPPPQGPR